MKIARSIRISGKVQGVFFRASAKDKADELNLSGFVRNEPDGSVYIEAEGEQEKLDQFIAWCRKGPRMSRVDGCEVVEKDVSGSAGFAIQR